MPTGIKGFQKGHPCFLKKHTPKTRRRLSLVNLGKKYSIKVREKMRLSHLGKKIPKTQILKMINSRKWYKHSTSTKNKMKMSKLGKNNPMFGKTPTIEHRRKLSESAKAYWGPRIDKTHKRLYERLRHSLEQRLWREKVFTRDGFKCTKCGDKRGGNLEADHIEAFIIIIKRNKITNMLDAIKCKELWDINNGRTLCKKCHRQTENWGTRAKKRN